MYILGPGDTLTEMSLQSGMVKSTMGKAVRIVGAGKSKTFTEIAGTNAPVRLQSGTPQVFVLGTPKAVPLPSRLDPSGIYATIVRLEVNKKAGTRELLAFSFAGYAGIGKARTQTADSVIPLDFSRFDDHAIRIQPRSVLPPGEYAFSAQARTVDPYANPNVLWYYCFGID